MRKEININDLVVRDEFERNKEANRKNLQSLRTDIVLSLLIAKFKVGDKIKIYDNGIFGGCRCEPMEYEIMQLPTLNYRHLDFIVKSESGRISVVDLDESSGYIDL